MNNIGTASKPNTQPSGQLPNSAVTLANVAAVFRGAKVVAVNKPLFCRHCDKDLLVDYDRIYASRAPVAELVQLLCSRRGKIIERTWPDRRDWGCSNCGRRAGVVVGLESCGPGTRVRE